MHLPARHVSKSLHSPDTVLDALRSLSISSCSTTVSPSLTFLRSASHATEGRVNSSKNGPGKRLGCKRTGGSHVLPNQIIFRQRGTTWHPGENTGRGRDHTIFSKVEGYVHYYRDPRRHPHRQFIGVCLEKDGLMPTPYHAARRRRLGLEIIPPVQEGEGGVAAVAAVGIEGVGELDFVLGIGNQGRGPVSVSLDSSGEKEYTIRPRTMFSPPTVLKLGDDYRYRESNFEIGRSGDKAQVRPQRFVKGDRWKAWRKRSEKKKYAIKMKKLEGGSKKKKKEKKAARRKAAA